MDEREQNNQIPCLVDEGIVVNRKDMARILRDLGHVRYTDIQGGQVRSEGEGLIANVFANPQGATIVVNKRLYINVEGFSHLRMSKLEDGAASIELVQEHRTIQLIPLSDPLAEGTPMTTLVVSGSTKEAFFGDAFAEVFPDDDFDDPEEE
jgi:hypothetical protein